MLQIKESNQGENAPKQHMNQKSIEMIDAPICKIKSDRRESFKRNSKAFQRPQPAVATNGGRQVTQQTVYVSNVDKNITKDMIRELFGVTGVISSIRIYPDKREPKFVYAFIEYQTPSEAELAIKAYNSKELNGRTITVKWAYQPQHAIRNAHNYNVFVGDLAPEVDDKMLTQAFANLGFFSILEASVIWDMFTGKSRGYGFVSFGDEQEANQAIDMMNGRKIGSRQVRVNKAQRNANTLAKNELKSPKTGDPPMSPPITPL